MKILIPVDGSTHANAALDVVASRTTLRAIDATGTRACQRAQADELLIREK